LTLVQGRRFQGDEPALLLGEILAGSIGKQAGDWVEVQGAPLRIVGVFRAQDTFSASTAVLPLHQLQRLSDLGTKVAGFHVRLRPSSPGVSPEDRLRRAKLAIESQLPGLKAMPAGIVAGDNHIVNFIRSTAWTTSLIALFIAVLGVANTMAMSVFERTREIGILRALGWSGSRIVRLIRLEASVLGLAGGLMGLAAGQFGLWALASIRATAGLPRVYPSPVHFGEAMCIALAISLAAGFLPAYRGARFPPTTALRYE
jgi:putative ABC transport system permease protein